MSRTALNFLLDGCLFLVFVALAWVSLVLHWVFPSPGNTKDWSLWGGGYADWARLQFYLVAALALGVLLHLMLHWSWVCGVVMQRLGRDKKRKLDDGQRTLYGVILLVGSLGLLGLAFLAAALSVQKP